MIEQGPITKLRILVPDSRHAADKIAGVHTNHGIPLRVRKNGGMHLEYPEDNPSLPFVYIFRKNSFIPEFIAEGRFPVGWTTTDRLEDYRARAAFSGDGLPISVKEILRLEVFNPLLRIGVLVDQKSNYFTLKDLNARDPNGGQKMPRIVTSYSGLAREYFERHNIQIELDGRGGKEEELVHDGDADAAVVAIDKGTTMRRFTLRELGDPVMGRKTLEGPVYGRGELKLVLICNPDLLQDKSIQLLLGKLMGKLQTDKVPNNNGELNGNSSDLFVLKGTPPIVVESQIPAAS